MKFDRTLIAGVPHSGKSTLATKLGELYGIPVLHTDDLIATLDWSAVSAEVALWIEKPGPWIIEGVAVPRALRKWLAANATGAPADRLIMLSQPRDVLTSGQEGMGKGVKTVLEEVKTPVLRRGLAIETHARAETVTL